MSDNVELPDAIVLAGDMALHWGVALGSVREGVVFASAHLDVSHTKGNPLRAQQTTEQIVEFVESCIDGGIDGTVYEAPTPASMSSAGSQYRMIAAFEEAGRRLGWPNDAATIYPSTLKKWATGNGRAEKHEITARANELVSYDSPIVDHNEADAVCLCALHLERVRAREMEKIARRLGRERRASA